MTTKNHKKSHLSAAQVVALNSLVSGARDEEAAREAKVCRETICRWRAHPHFQAELNRRQLEIWESNKQMLRALVSAAIETIEEAVKNNPNIAMKILEKCQGFDVIQPPTGPTTVEGILGELALERAEEELAATREERTGQLHIIDPFEHALQLRPLIEKHLLSLRKEHGLQ